MPTLCLPPTPPSHPQLNILIPSSSPPTPPLSSSSSPLTPSQIPHPPSLLTPPPCLQCALTRQKCSLSTHHHLYHLFHNKTSTPIVSCTRCVRNGEDVCLRVRVRDGDVGGYWGYWYFGERVIRVGKKAKVRVEEVEEEEVEGRVRELIHKSEVGRRWMRPFPRPQDWTEKVESLRDAGGESWREKWIKKASVADDEKARIEEEKDVEVEKQKVKEDIKAREVRQEENEGLSYVLTMRKQLETMLKEQKEVQEGWQLPSDLKMAFVSKIRKQLEKKLGAGRKVEQIREKPRGRPGSVLEMRKRLEGKMK